MLSTWDLRQCPVPQHHGQGSVTTRTARTTSSTRHHEAAGGRPVIVDVASKDVIHNLALVPMRAAQDATPGVKSHMWFKPTKTGTWDIICGQLCGPGHAQMKAILEVVDAEEYDAWAKEQSLRLRRRLKEAEAAAPKPLLLTNFHPSGPWPNRRAK
jgi:cytochrome c oxidase subunit 2